MYLKKKIILRWRFQLRDDVDLALKRSDIASVCLVFMTMVITVLTKCVQK